MNILGFTGSRAEYYLQRPLFLRLLSEPDVNLRVIVSGSILDESSSQTLIDIQNDSIPILAKIPLQSSLTDVGHNIQLSHLLSKLDPIIKKSEIDISIVYADRYESFAFALASFHNDLIIMHFEAGDITEGGTYDDSLRHCITKLSHLQTTSTARGLSVLTSLGEEPWRSTHIGLMSYESFLDISIDQALQVASDLSLDPTKALIIGTMHSIPMDPSLTFDETSSFLNALSSVSKTNLFDIIITSPNNDQGSYVISSLIDDYLPSIDRCIYIENLGGYRYQSLLSLARQQCVIVCGNSSSVIKEAPFYGAHGLNIGRRQAGREKAESQVDVPASAQIITETLQALRTKPCEVMSNPYLKANPSEHAVQFLLSTISSRTRQELLLKRWHSPFLV